MVGPEGLSVWTVRPADSRCGVLSFLCVLPAPVDVVIVESQDCSPHSDPTSPTRDLGRLVRLGGPRPGTCLKV